MKSWLIIGKVIGRLLGQFKKNWMIANFYYRFGAKKGANLTGGLDNEGFYNTFWKNVLRPKEIVSSVTGETVDEPFWKSFLMSVPRFTQYLMRFSYLGKKLGFGPKPGEYDEMTEANLKKFMRELSWATTVVTSMLVLESMAGGSSAAAQSWERIYAINQLARLQRDVMQFMDPQEFGSIIKNPVPLLSNVTDWYGIMFGAVKTGILGDPNGTMGSHFMHGVINQFPIVRQIPASYNKVHKAIVYGIN